MKDMTKIVHELRELKRMREEIDDQIEELEDVLKAEMTSNNTDTISGYDWKVTWRFVSAKRLNQEKLKEKYPDIAYECTSVSSYRKFLVK